MPPKRKTPRKAEAGATASSAAELDAPFDLPPVTVTGAATAAPPTPPPSPPPPMTVVGDAAATGGDEIYLSDDGSDAASEVVLFPDAEDLLNTNGGADDGVVNVGNFQPRDDESDSSEDDYVLNRVGDIPLEWYDDEKHIGYDIEGRKLMRGERSALEKLIAATDDPNAVRTIRDALHDQTKVLSNADLQVIFNLLRNRTPNAGFKMYDEAAAAAEGAGVEFDPLNHPLARGAGPSKKTFVPRLHEMKKLQKMIRRLLKTPDPNAKKKTAEEEAEEARKKEEETFLIWDDQGNAEMDSHAQFKYANRIDKPKVAPPGTFESYRPPTEYLPSDRARERHLRLRKLDRKEHFLPQQFGALRHVPFYNHTIQDRYQRCLDLAFFPRMQRTRLVVDPNKLLPELPQPQDLRPFPERLSFLYKGHTATVRSLSLSPSGEYLATGCDDHLVRIFEVMTGRLVKRYDVGGPVMQVEFCPNRMLNILAVAVEFSLIFIVPSFVAHPAVNDHSVRFLRAPGLAANAAAAAAAGEEGALHRAGGAHATHGGGITQAVQDKDESVYEAAGDLHDVAEKEKRAEFVDASAIERSAGIIVKITMHARVRRFTFHAKGDYLCALCPKDHVKYRQTIMLQLSKRKVFCPFRKFSEVVTDCRFHPREPLFFLSTTNSVRCYNLLAHKLQKRYKAHGGVTTCLAMHPEGDNFLVGDTTCHTQWFDCDFSDKPYKRMRSHKAVVNAVSYHPLAGTVTGDASASAAGGIYPLFATAGADGQVHVFHGAVYDDYNKNALIVPLKVLKHRRPAYAVAWHPSLPWVFTSTEDGTVSCWTE